MWIGKTLPILGLVCLMGQSAWSETDSTKLDEVLSITREIRTEMKPHSGIDRKFWGLEFNPVLPLVSAESGLWMTGGVQFFNWDRHAEFSFPFQILQSDNSDAFTLDLHYRRFLGDAQKGFYLSGFLRGAYINQNYLTNDFDQAPFEDTRLGLGAGLGHRIYSKGGLYWGCSLNLGRYVIYDEPENHFDLFGLGALNSLIFDVEFFKFGFAF